MTPENIDALVDALNDDLSVTAACRRVGINPESARAHMRRHGDVLSRVRKDVRWKLGKSGALKGAHMDIDTDGCHNCRWNSGKQCIRFPPTPTRWRVFREESDREALFSIEVAESNQPFVDVEVEGGGVLVHQCGEWEPGS